MSSETYKTYTTLLANYEKELKELERAEPRPTGYQETKTYLLARIGHCFNMLQSPGTMLTEKSWLQQIPPPITFLLQYDRLKATTKKTGGPVVVEAAPFDEQILDYVNASDEILPFMRKRSFLRVGQGLAGGQEATVTEAVGEIVYPARDFVHSKVLRAANEGLRWKPLASAPPSRDFGPALQPTGAAPAQSSSPAANRAAQVVEQLAGSSTTFTDLLLELVSKESPGTLQEVLAILASELKAPGVIKHSPSMPAPDFVDIWSRRHRLDKKVEIQTCCAICQLWQYMLRHRVMWGMLSTAELWYFCKRRNNDLLVSRAIRWDSETPTVLAAVTWAINEAVKSRSELPLSPPTASGTFDPDHHVDEEPDDDSDVEEEDKDSDYTPSEERRRPTKRLRYDDPGPSRQQPSTQRGMQAQQIDFNQLKDIPAENLHLEEEPMAHGWSGVVVKGCIGAEQAAIKLAPAGSARAQALLNEARAYMALRPLWTRQVPKLLSYGTTANRRVVYIATQFLQGHHPWELQVTQAEAEAAEAALRAVHAAGLLHGDVKEDNLLLQKSTEKAGPPSALLLDFGFARQIETPAETEREVNQLRSMLHR